MGALDREQLQALAEAFEAQSNFADRVGGDAYRIWLDQHIGSLAEEIYKDSQEKGAEVNAHSAREAAKVYAYRNLPLMLAEQDALKASWQKDITKVVLQGALAVATGNPIGLAIAVSKAVTKDRAADVEAIKKSAMGFDSRAQKVAEERGMRANSPEREAASGRWAATVALGIFVGAVLGSDMALNSDFVQANNSPIPSIEESQSLANSADPNIALENTHETNPEGAGAPKSIEQKLPSGDKTALEETLNNSEQSNESTSAEHESGDSNVPPPEVPESDWVDGSVVVHDNGSVSINTGVWGEDVKSIQCIDHVCQALNIDVNHTNRELIRGFIGSHSVDHILATHSTPSHLINWPN